MIYRTIARSNCFSLKVICRLKRLYPRVELLRSKFKRSTQKSRSMSTQIDFGLNVDIDNRVLGRHIFTTMLMSTLKINIEDHALCYKVSNIAKVMNVDLT